MAEVEQVVEASLTKLIRVLDRRERIPALETLAVAVKGVYPEISLAASAIVLDANVFLRIPSHKKSSDIMDYLTGPHEKPIVVPGQIIQEFWNNHLSAVDTVYKTVSKKHQEMSKEVEKYKLSGVAGVEPVAEAIEAFRANNEHIFEPELMSKTSGFLERLVEKAIVPFAPRAPLAEIAMHRKRAKTPPGFKDEGDGDFLVWTDLLWGLLEAQEEGMSFDNVILVSNDAKVDWSRGKSAHPLLVAELKATLNAHFTIWNLDQLADAIAN
ncbi:PIN-like domain-containing protein [Agrobacterium salinitolerans]|uniref:PIN-like domain-containing protein n=1 Tax=Agrobacterium salinitolerans TaxID=1183413 RepID=UPI0022B83F75|nr:PIN-like domain-containing protein [Agrobacterium salinitolerans]MCZ7858965.1 PIN-like domain-containing protein [Agrobacterium salinitolerans]